MQVHPLHPGYAYVPHLEAPLSITDDVGLVDAVFAVAVDGRLNVNVALNRPSYLSSIWKEFINPHIYAFPASLANDGSHATNLQAGPCAATQAEVNPWWAVDLLLPLYVFGIKFTNRDALGIRLLICCYLGVCTAVENVLNLGFYRAAWNATRS